MHELFASLMSEMHLGTSGAPKCQQRVKRRRYGRHIRFVFVDAELTLANQ